MLDIAVLAIDIIRCLGKVISVIDETVYETVRFLKATQ